MPKRVDDRTLYMRRWREKNRAKNDAYQAEWKKAHKAEVSLYNKLYRAAHKAEHREINERYRKKHPARFKAIQQAAAAKRRYPGFISAADVLAVIKRSKNRCYWCGKMKLKGGDLTLEHLQPVNDVSALVVACLSCNASRKANNGAR